MINTSAIRTVHDDDEKGIINDMGGRPATSVLFVVLPYRIANNNDTTKKGARSFLSFPYGVLSMATYVKNKASGNPLVRILDLNLYELDDIDSILKEKLVETAPDIVGISFTFDISYRYIYGVSNIIKSTCRNALIVLGGTSVTVSIHEILDEQPCVDALCFGEGDVAMKRLVEADDRKRELCNDPWVTRESLACGRQPSNVFLSDISELIPIEYDLLDVAAYSMNEAFSPYSQYLNRENVKQYFIVTSRGCPFKCSFCAEPSYQGKGMRFADLDVVMAHVDYLVKDLGMNVLTIYDAQLIMNQQRAKELFRRLAPYNLRIEMPNGVTVVYIDDELAYLMRQAGVHSLYLAIESGSDRVLKLLRKPVKLSKVGSIVEMLHKYGFFVEGYFITGYPGEQDEDREQTLQFIQDVALDWSGFSLCQPLRGSELYKICKENDWIDKKYAGIGDIGITNYVINVPGVDPNYIVDQTYLMNLNVNFVNNYRMRSGDYQFSSQCFKAILERWPNHAFALWFLARSLEKMRHDHEEIGPLERSYFDIVTTNDKWRNYARHFGLPLTAANLVHDSFTAGHDPMISGCTH